MDNTNIIYEYPNPDRLVIIGDIHGDIKRFKNILIDANIITIISNGLPNLLILLLYKWETKLIV